MPRAVGSPKTGGRKKGTPNKRTSDLVEALESQGLDIVAKLAETLPELEAEKRADVLLNLMSYLYPKRKSVEHVGVERPTRPQVVMYIPKNGSTSGENL